MRGGWGKVVRVSFIFLKWPYPGLGIWQKMKIEISSNWESNREFAL